LAHRLWNLASGSISFGIDKLEPCVELARSSLAAAGMSARATIACGSVEDAGPAFERRFNRVVSINAAQYMDKERLFRFVHRSLEHKGEFLLSVQTPEYFLGAAWAAMTSSEARLDEAAGRLEIIIQVLQSDSE